MLRATELVDGRQLGRLLRFQQPMQAIFARSREIDLRRFEVANEEEVGAVLRPAVESILSESRALLGAVLDACEHEQGAEDGAAEDLRVSYLPFERAVDATITAKLGSWRAIEDLAFIGQMELRRRAERIERLTISRGKVLFLGEADSALRWTRKSLSAVESAIAAAEGSPPLLTFASETQVSLAIRRTYAKFQASLLGEGEPTEKSLLARFRAAGTQIAMLIGREIYPEMRIHDRLLLRDLQQRILAWLRGADRSTSEGHRLWQDLTACVEMLSLVNRRQELMEHDAAAVGEALRRVGNDGTVVGDDAWSVIQHLEGLDPELDKVLAARPRHEAEPVRRILARLSTIFVRPPPRGEVEPTW